MGKHMPNYQTRDSLKQSLGGPYYQVLVILNYMLDALQRGRQFNAMLELAGVGALDDVVIEYLDKAKKVERKLFLQLKHANDNTEKLTESDFTTKIGKFEIYKYFDDWYLFIKKDPTHNCIYYTDRNFCDALKPKLNTNNKIAFCQAKAGYVFTDYFFQDRKVNSLYSKIIKIIKENSVMCDRSLVEQSSPQKRTQNPSYAQAFIYYQNGGVQLSPQEAEVQIKRFLQEYYVMQVGQQHVDELEKTVEGQIKQYFTQAADTDVIFNAVIRDVL